MNIDKVRNNTVINNQSTLKTNDTKDTSFEEVLNANNKKEVNANNIFQDAANKYGVPANLLKAVAKVESNYNPNAVSSAGASGVMQLMPATAKGLGVTDVFDPVQNIHGGAKYLSQLYKKYDGNLELTLAGYNAGPGNVAKYGGVPPFKETQNYIVKVKKALNDDGGNVELMNFKISAGSKYKSLSQSTSQGIDGLDEDGIKKIYRALAEGVKMRLLEEVGRRDSEDEDDKYLNK